MSRDSKTFSLFAHAFHRVIFSESLGRDLSYHQAFFYLSAICLRFFLRQMFIHRYAQGLKEGHYGSRTHARKPSDIKFPSLIQTCVIPQIEALKFCVWLNIYFGTCRLRILPKKQKIPTYDCGLYSSQQ